MKEGIPNGVTNFEVNKSEESLKKPSVVDLYRRVNSLPLEDFIKENPAKKVVDEWHRQNGKPVSDESRLDCLRTLHPEVVGGVTNETYEKVKRDGMPWKFAKSQHSRRMMVSFIDDNYISPHLERHIDESFVGRVNSDIGLFERLEKAGKIRESDVEGVNYARFVDEVKPHEERPRSFRERLTEAALPFVKIASDFMSSEADMARFKKLTGEYQEICDRGKMWLGGILEVAEPIKAAHEPENPFGENVVFLSGKKK